MTDFAHVKTTIEERIAMVTLDNPPVNILTSEIMEEIAKTFDELEKNPEVKAVVFTTAGTQAFIAGANIKEIAQIQDKPKGMELALRGQEVLNKIEFSRKINIAAIHGICVGGGNELIMAFHFRIAGERAKFGQPEISLGIIPGFGGTQRLARLAGVSKALELILTGDMVNAQEALRIGLVNRVVPDGEVIKQARGLAKKIAAKGALSVQLAKRAVVEGAALPLSQGLKLEAELFGQIAESEDKKEGIQAFLEKRQPKFSDR